MNWKQERIWISGATGAWGHELCKLALMKGVEKVIAYGRSEHRLEALMAWLKHELPHDAARVRVHLGDVRDAKTLRLSLRDVTIVIHAAALKRIESGAESPWEVASTNIDGTKVVADAVLHSSVTRAFYVSSDKACEPTTFYGATKFVAEELWRGANVYSPKPYAPWFVAGRFGNVLGSTGSVLKVWAEQVRQGKPLVMYDPDMTRFVLTQRDAVRHVFEMIEAMRGEQSLVTPWGMRAVRIGTLAQAFAPGWQIEYKTQRITEGEKMHERLTAPGILSCHAPPFTTEEMRKVLELEGLTAEQLVKGWKP